MKKTKLKPGFLFYFDCDVLRLSWGNLEEEEKAKTLLEINEIELMKLEKKRLGIPPDRLVFIGMANCAKYYWCAWQYYLKSKREEIGFFLAYFEDRLTRSNELNLLKKFPKKVTDILKIGDEINTRDIHNLWLKRKKNFTPPDSNHKITVETYEITENTSPLKKGEIYHITRAEHYPSIRWNFRYKDMVLIGIPDGIADEFVYEFKYTGKKASISEVLMSATCQADVYGYYFQRPKRRVQIFCGEDEKVYTYDNEITKQKVIDLLEKWIDLRNGKMPIKPKSRKCGSCEFKEDCELLKLG